MEQNSTKTDADGTALFAGTAWFDPIEAGIRERGRVHSGAAGAGAWGGAGPRSDHYAVRPTLATTKAESNFRFGCFCNGPLVVKLQSASSRRFRASVRGRCQIATSCCLRERRSNLPGVVSGSLPATATEPASPSPHPGDGTSWELDRLAPLRTLVSLLAATLPLRPRPPGPCPRRTPSRLPTSGAARWPVYAPAPLLPAACPGDWRRPWPSASAR